MQCISSKVSWPCKCLVTCLLPDSDYALLKFLPRFCFLSSYRYFADKIRWVHTDIALFLPSFLFFRDVAAYAMRKLLFDVSAPCFCVWWAEKQKSEPSLHSPSTFPFLENSKCPGCRPSEKMKLRKSCHLNGLSRKFYMSPLNGHGLLLCLYSSLLLLSHCFNLSCW